MISHCRRNVCAHSFFAIFGKNSRRKTSRHSSYVSSTNKSKLTFFEAGHAFQTKFLDGLLFTHGQVAA